MSETGEQVEVVLIGSDYRAVAPVRSLLPLLEAGGVTVTHSSRGSPRARPAHGSRIVARSVVTLPPPRAAEVGKPSLAAGLSPLAHRLIQVLGAVADEPLPSEILEEVILGDGGGEWGSEETNAFLDTLTLLELRDLLSIPKSGNTIALRESGREALTGADPIAASDALQVVRALTRASEHAARWLKTDADGQTYARKLIPHLRAVGLVDQAQHLAELLEAHRG